MSIEVKGLTHIYSEGLPHESVALENVSFNVEDGQLVGVIGHTGSGKSTLVQHLNGLLRPKSGTIVVGDVDITADGVVMRDIRRKIGLVFQYPEYQLFEETVAKDVAFGPGNLGLSQEETEQRVKEAIQMVGLDYDAVKNVSPFELSGGQKRRVAIAGVIAMKPRCIVLDEPTAMLDPNGRKEVLRTVEELRKKEKVTVILITHYMEEVIDADKVFVMDHGHVVMEGTPREIFSQVDTLKKYRLDVPQVTILADELKKRGLDIPAGILRKEELVEAICRLK